MVVVIEAVAVVDFLWLPLKLSISPSSGNFRLIVCYSLGSECKIFIKLLSILCLLSSKGSCSQNILIFYHLEVEICCVFIVGLP